VVGVYASANIAHSTSPEVRMLCFIRVGSKTVYSVKQLFQNIFKFAACIAIFNAVVNSECPSKSALKRLKNLSAEKGYEIETYIIIFLHYKAPFIYFHVTGQFLSLHDGCR
jgi:hypothetical protein